MRDVMQAGRRTSTRALVAPRTNRNHDVRVLTSIPAGRFTPIAAIPLLREDALSSLKLRLSFESMETAEILMNAITVDVRAHLVPNLAFPRFSGIDELNRSYQGIAETGGAVTPYFNTAVYKEAVANPIHKYLGKHARNGDTINMAYVEAYNVLWNWLARNRSKDLTERLLTDVSLAPAFWRHAQFDHIVPDFDQALIDGAVPVLSDGLRAPVTGIYTQGTGTGSVVGAGGDPAKYDTIGGHPGGGERVKSTMSTDANNVMLFKMQQQAGVWWPAIYAELQDAGLTISLATIELAKKTQAFAQLRTQFTGLEDDYIIDLLMDAITVPEQAWRQPMLLGQSSTIFGMAKRYASDGANLTESVVNGATFVDLVLRTPTVPCGGIIVITAEILPEQMFERQADPYLYTTAVDTLPAYLRDTLDPEKVEVVKCGEIDVDHDTPKNTFGYQPLNARWNSAHPCIGGRFHRPKVDAGFSEDRQRIWAVEQKNPVLSEDFYVSKNIHTKVFVVTNQDPFEVVARGTALISGNTVFGGALMEADGDYEAVLADAPVDKIDKV